jgi:2-polyprenyl-3-methyl-5-hydroxy-6-metoxy-1,4-benzoquinol methylase
MAKATLPNDGERMIPEYHKGLELYGEHLARYQIVEPLINNKVVLDIACGSGYGSAILATHAKKVTGIDVDKDAVEYAKANYLSSKINFTHGDASDIPMSDKSVDVIISYETVEHVKDYKKFISETKRVLKKDGVLVISTPNEKTFYDDNPFHKHEFEFMEFLKLLKSKYRNVEPYFQSTWLYNSILDQELVNKEWRQSVDTINTIANGPHKAIFFIMVCSDERLPKLQPLGTISRTWSEKDELLAAKKQALTDQHVTNLEIMIGELQDELKSLKNSRTYKAARRISSIKKLRH